MLITVFCSEEKHPVNNFLNDWIKNSKCNQHITLVRDITELKGGDILFLVSCSTIVDKLIRKRYKFTLVLHASNLPKGRGWSPHIWQIIEGKKYITLCLLSAEDRVDTGMIWLRKQIEIPRHFLWNEINEIIFASEINLMQEFIDNYEKLIPSAQNEEIIPTYYLRRLPQNSRLNPHESIEAQFDLIRVCDPTRFPAFFELHGFRYKVIIEKINE
jgi:methionyl-tRNA formyltransferase